MSARTKSIVLATMLLIIIVALVVSTRSLRSRKMPSGIATSAQVVAQTTGIPANIISTAAPKKLQQRANKPLSAHSLYANQDLFEKDRSTFHELAEQAASGDTEALFYAQQQLRYCRALSGITEHGFTGGPVTSYRERMLSRLERTCEDMRTAPGYQTVKDFMDQNWDGVLVRGLAGKIKRAFAREGLDQAVQVGLGGLKSRPTLVTVGVVEDTFAALGITSYLEAKLLRSRTTYAESEKATPPQRDVMDGALTMYACNSGMPCGPYSGLVMEGCVGSGQCVPGHGLERYLRYFGATRAQWDDLETVLRYLQSVPPAAVVWD